MTAPAPLVCPKCGASGRFYLWVEDTRFFAFDAAGIPISTPTRRSRTVVECRTCYRRFWGPKQTAAFLAAAGPAAAHAFPRTKP